MPMPRRKPILYDVEKEFQKKTKYWIRKAEERFFKEFEELEKALESEGINHPVIRLLKQLMSKYFEIQLQILKLIHVIVWSLYQKGR